MTAPTPEPFDREGLFAKASFETRDERRLWRLAIEQRGRADRAEIILAMVDRDWKLFQGAQRDILNGRPVDDALEEQHEVARSIDQHLAKARA